MRLWDVIAFAASAALIVGCGGGASPAQFPGAASPAAAPTSAATMANLEFGVVFDPALSAFPGFPSLESLETAFGRKFNFDEHYYFITDLFPTAELANDAANGRIPIISLNCSGYTNADIAAGLRDAAIDKAANALKDYGHTVLIRYLWEMNSSIASDDRNGCTGPHDTNGFFNAPDFIAAWDHLRARFIADGATNVKWYWCPNDSAATLSAYFPGVSNVDYVGVDIFDRTVGNYAAFTSHVQATYAAIENDAPGVPFIVGETGAQSADQVTFFNSLRTLSATMPHIVAWVYFDAVGPLGDWRVQPGTAQFAAFERAVDGS